jgi:phage virion morphogenesis protein
MSELQLINDRLEALISSLSAPARKEMARNIGRKLRASQQQNIKRQQAPDGTPFKPRKTQPVRSKTQPVRSKTQPVRSKKGRIKREMFAKLRTAKYMKTKASPNEAVIEFAGNVQRMARVHHYGLRDRPSRKGKEVRYEARPLLGISENDMQLIARIFYKSF